MPFTHISWNRYKFVNSLRLKILRSNPSIKRISFSNKEQRECEAFVQQVGFNSDKEIRELLKLSCYSSCIPEGLRLADKIGQSFKGFVL